MRKEIDKYFTQSAFHSEFQMKEPIQSTITIDLENSLKGFVFKDSLPFLVAIFLIFRKS